MSVSDAPSVPSGTSHLLLGESSPREALWKDGEIRLPVCAWWFKTSRPEMQPTSGRNAEAELQRRLAKRLGLKSRRAGLGGDDGLDDLLDGLDDG